MKFNWILLISLLILCSAQAQDRVTDQTYHFSFQPLDSSWQVTTDKINPIDIYDYRRVNPDGSSCIFCLQPLKSKAISHPANAADFQILSTIFPAGTTCSGFAMMWNNHEIFGIKSLIPADKRLFCGEEVQLPLSPSTIQAIIVGPPSMEDYLRSSLEKIVSNTKGDVQPDFGLNQDASSNESTWLTPEWLGARTADVLMIAAVIWVIVQIRRGKLFESKKRF